MMLESFMHTESMFLTLTYNDESIPNGHTLLPADLQKFLKRVRRHFSERKIRFYAVGEYGDNTQRPHYHVILFGAPGCLYLRGNSQRCSCNYCALYKRLWGLGHVDLGEINKDSLSYATGYVTKKLTKKDDPRLNGRHPEFARMSNRPGIGALSMLPVANAIASEGGAADLIARGDVPFSLMHGKKFFPLGRYLREKLRLYYGFEKKETPKELLEKMSKEMCELYELEYLTEGSPKGKEFAKWFKQRQKMKTETKKQQIANVHSVYQVKNKKGIL